MPTTYPLHCVALGLIHTSYTTHPSKGDVSIGCFHLAACTHLVGGVLDRRISAGAEALCQDAAITAVVHAILQEFLLCRGCRGECPFTCSVVYSDVVM